MATGGGIRGIASICTRQEPLLHMFDYVKEGERVEDGMIVTSRGGI